MLDVDGQIRIRGGGPATGLVLTSDADGLAQWAAPPTGGITSLSQDTTNPGIILNPNPVTGIGTVGVDSSYIQRRVTTTCPAGQEMYSISSTGAASCRAGTIKLTAGSGLSASPANPITNSGTLTIDPAYTQRRLTGVPCPAGQISNVASDGTVTCHKTAQRLVLPVSSALRPVLASWRRRSIRSLTPAP
ncbi:MAG: hypothetical protein HYT47_01965 [Candidatus Vogelbacteria bacterium]|nr:hypothetical protein [Candidatus Vogelbacteria bacterium]